MIPAGTLCSILHHDLFNSVMSSIFIFISSFIVLFFPSNVHGLQTLGIKIIAGWLMGHRILLLCLFCSRESVYLQCRHVLWCQLRDTLNL